MITWKKQHTTMATRLLFSIFLLMSFNSFAVSGGLAAETAARKAADTALQNAIATETAARIAADTLEATTRGNADTAEAAARQAADTVLQNQINNIPVPPIYAIGDNLPDNSIVYWVDASGEHGLAAWPTDDDESNWYAANVAADDHGPGWHLPTKKELDLLYAQRAVVGGFASGLYWGSSEFDGDGAWFQNFVYGAQGLNAKNYGSLRVRAVRAF